MNELLGKLDYWNLLIVSAIVTLVVSAVKISFNDYFSDIKKHRQKLMSFAVVILVTFLNVSLMTKSSKLFWQEIITQFLLIWAFATLFNSLLGNWFIDTLFSKIKTLLTPKE